MQPPQYVLILDQQNPQTMQVGVNLAALHAAELLIARSHHAALEFAQNYQPAFVVIGEQMLDTLGESFPCLLRDVSPNTHVILTNADRSESAYA